MSMVRDFWPAQLAIVSGIALIALALFFGASNAADLIAVSLGTSLGDLVPVIVAIVAGIAVRSALPAILCCVITGVAYAFMRGSVSGAPQELAGVGIAVVTGIFTSAVGWLQERRRLAKAQLATSCSSQESGGNATATSHVGISRRRGWRRLWLAGSGMWSAYIVLYQCAHPNLDPWSTIIEGLIGIVTLPTLALLLAFVARWVWQGFAANSAGSRW